MNRFVSPTLVQLCFIAFIFLLGPMAKAGFLKLVPEFDIHADSSGKNVQITAIITNQGDERAREIQLVEPESHSTSAAIPILEAGENVRISLIIPWAQLRPHDRPASKSGSPVALPVRIRYRDANGYAFSAPYVNVLGESTNNADVTLTWDQPTLHVPLSGKQTVSVILKGPPGVRYHVIGFSAEELRISNVPSDFVMETAGQRELIFSVENISALNHSSYPLYAIVATEHGNGEGAVHIFSASLLVMQDSHLAATFILAGLLLLLVVSIRSILFKTGPLVC